MTSAVLDSCEELRDRARDARSLTYTELARSKEWRTALADDGILRIAGSRACSEGAWLVSQRYMDTLLELIEQTEAEREEEQINAMLEARSDYQNWMQGDELAHAAVTRFLERRTAIAEALDGHI